MELRSEKSANSERTTVKEAGLEDLATLDDKLGFEPYVGAIASFLSHYDTRAPFTLSIEGEWGSGKSSFMLQLQDELQFSGATVSFNAWRHDKVESMWAAFALNVVNQLNKRLGFKERVRRNLLLSWEKFNFSKGWSRLLLNLAVGVFFIYIIVLLVRMGINGGLAGAIGIKDGEVQEGVTEGFLKPLGWIGGVIGIGFFLRKLVEIFGNPLLVDLKKFMASPNYGAYSSFIEEFHDDFKTTVNVLAKDVDKVFIFIDDLDRSDVSKAADLMQGLNLMISDSEKIIFIIGMDRDKVAAGIAAKFKDQMRFLTPSHLSLDTEKGIMEALEFGHNYLQKFIQLSFQVPKPSQDFLSKFIDDLGGKEEIREKRRAGENVFDPSLFLDDGEDSEDFKITTLLFASEFDNNPRRIKQFVNAYRLKIYIAYSTGLFKKGTGGKGLTIQQVGKFVAMTMLWPEIVPDLLEYPNLLSNITNHWRGVGTNAANSGVQTGGSSTTHPVQLNDIESAWFRDQAFRSFLVMGETIDPYNFSMEYVDCIALLQTTPKVEIPSRRRRKREVSKPIKEGQSQTFDDVPQ